MLEVKHVTKTYGGKNAVEDLNFTLEKGAAVGFLGPNGAGKSTTMNIITGYLDADEGSVLLDGVRMSENPIGYKKKIGYLPEVPPLYGDMTLDEYLSFVFDLKKVAGDREKEIGEITELAKVGHVRHRLLKNLSKGYKQRVGVAQALLGRPPLLVLDEPTIGLDPRQIVEIRLLLKELKSEHTILLSSHILSEITEVCDRVILLREGKLIADDSKENLMALPGGRMETSVTTLGDAGKLMALLGRMAGVLTCRQTEAREADRQSFVVESKTEVRDKLCMLLTQNGYPVYEIAKRRTSLEDVFMRLTGKREDAE
ncbi:ABC transporter ATP-binding protein [Christensenella timonensis]|uniref:ABC transporter ATP-binding protein n=1 Tax=Christensenella timonensis TaxID=1816678 RepID=UPI000836532F|nr:ABC transporter ATP-binding protein [Christensenella timonensis]